MRVSNAMDCFSPLFEELSLLCGLRCEDASLTQQSQAEEADINVIVRRFGLTGVLPQAAMPPLFADFEDVFDFQTAQNALIAARSSFMEMDAEVRERFGNDPHRFVAFCSDEKNKDDMKKMGLLVPDVVVEPEKIMKVEVVVQPAAKPAVAS